MAGAIALVLIFLIAFLFYKYDFFCCGILVILAVLVAYVVVRDKNCSVEKYESVPLYAGSNGLEIHGSFRSINEVDTVYYWVDDHGIKTKHSAPMSESAFIEDGNRELIMRYYGCNSYFWWGKARDVYLYEFHVPEGSVSSIYFYE